MPDASSPPECLACGACCFSPSEQYVWVTGYDWTRLGEEAERLAHFIGNRAFMKMRAGHCAALEIRPAAAGPVFHCTIYERRPEICRALARGSPECAAELPKRAAPPLELICRSAGPAAAAPARAPGRIG